MAIWNRITAFITGGAVATATADALRPEFEVLRQTAWSNEPHRVLPAELAAEALAREKQTDLPGVDLHGVDLQDDASRNGVGSARFKILAELAQTQPGVGELIRLRRRNQANPDNGITDPELTEALRRHGYSAENVHAIRTLVTEPLDPAQLAAAIHRGLVPDPGGLLKGEQPEPPFKVEAYPVYPIDPLDEAKSSGYDHDRLGVLVGLQGLPMGTHEAAQALFRGIITHGDYVRAFNTSNSRNEWAEAVLGYSRQIPTARDFLENALRGYRDLDGAVEGAALHGMSKEHATLIYQNQGRPMQPRLITQALSRGGVFKPEPGEITDPYMAAIVEGNLKPAYYDLAYANRYQLPSAFAMKSLATSGVWDEAKTAQRLKDIGWPPEDAEQVAKAWTAGTGGTGDPHIKKAQTQLWNTTHSSYLTGETDDPTAAVSLQTAGVDPGSITDVINLWAAERELVRKQLTPAQIKKAYSAPVVNPATGANWTRDEAIAELMNRGYGIEDAQTFLEL